MIVVSSVAFIAYAFGLSGSTFQASLRRLRILIIDRGNRTRTAERRISFTDLLLRADPTINHRR
jgi:hypothetical protein